jgi:fructokinase
LIGALPPELARFQQQSSAPFAPFMVPAGNQPRMICFGEALWDILPRGIFLGGAPLNVAYHLSRHGVQVLPVSAVGRDFLGDEAVRRVRAWGVDGRGVARLRGSVRTGTVRAQLDERGVATYRIARDVAWDRIPPPKGRIEPPAAIVYGSLALRSASNRRTLDQLFARWPRATRVLDINLRPPFDRGEAVEFALQRAQLVKLNDEELGRLMGGQPRTPRALARTAAEFARARGIAQVCVTAGARGAGLWWHGHWTWEPARPVAVRDTVGSGDAFLAALLAGLWGRQVRPAVALANACRLGEFVAMSDGATPLYRCDSRGRPRRVG